MGRPELPSIPDADIAAELRRRTQRLERAGPWEIALGAAVGVALLATLVCAVRESAVTINLQISASIFFAGLVLLLLLAWLARDRAKQGLIGEFQALIEMDLRRYRTEQALRDPLTGVYSKAGLQELGPGYLKRAERSGSMLAVIVLDLDDFHDLNKTQGHTAGDAALVEFAAALQSSIRGSDFLLRYGGDEFVILLEETSPQGTDAVIRRIDEKLSRRNQQLLGQFPLKFTAGIAAYEKGMDFGALFDLADRDMLAKKQARGKAVR